MQDLTLETLDASSVSAEEETPPFIARGQMMNINMQALAEGNNGERKNKRERVDSIEHGDCNE